MFVRSRSPQPKGTRVRVVIGLPDGSRFPLEGEVVDVRERPDGSGGNGIRFVDLDDTRLAMLESYIDASAAGVPQPILGDDSDISLVNVIEPEAQRKLQSKVSGAAKRGPDAGLPRLGASEPPSPDLLLRLDRSLRQIEPLSSADPYEVLGLEPHAISADITQVLARRLQEFAHAPSDGTLPTRLATRLDQARGKLNLAAQTLLDPATRAVQDLALGFLVPATREPAVRQAFERELDRRRTEASPAERAEFELALPVLELAAEKRAAGDLKAARSLYRAALLYDPHNLQIREVAVHVRTELTERAPTSAPAIPAAPAGASRPAPRALPSVPAAPPAAAPAAAPAAPAFVGPDSSEPITMEVDPEPSEPASFVDEMEPPSRSADALGDTELDALEPARSGSKLGTLVGVGVLAAAAAVGILVFTGSGSDAPGDRAAAADGEPATPDPAPADPAASADAPAEATPPPASPPEAEPTDPVDDGSEAPEAAPEAAEPEGSSSSAGESAPAPDGPFADAQRAYDAGEYQRAYELADAVGGKSNARFEIMALAQCQLDDGAVAREQFRKLVGRNTRREIGDACAQLGINVFAKGKGYTAEELLRKAASARASGDPEAGCKFAEQSNKKSSSAAAMELLGICACEAGDRIRAKRMLRFLSDENDGPIIAACASAGIEL